MMLDTVEQWVRWIGAADTLVTLAVVLLGLARSLTRPRGRAIGRANQMLRLPTYLLISIGYFGLWYLLWKPIPIALSPAVRIVALALGALLLFPGLGLVLWGRLVLGKMYNVSSALGAQLYADQQLITHGPYAIVRNPMYVGIIAATLGGLLIYRTWSLVFALTFFGLVIRARREEEALSAEFGAAWEAYCQRVPAWLPHTLRVHRDGARDRI
jgi:protein-S-isoprenylcysteine O-methyltransferase Ste14